MGEGGLQRKEGDLMGDTQGDPLPTSPPPQQRGLVEEHGQVERVADAKTS